MRTRFIPFNPDVPNKLEDLVTYLRNFVAQLNNELNRVNYVLNGRVTFGSESVDNIAGKWATFTTTGSEVEITHDLGMVPVGVLVMVPPDTGFVIKGTTPWTTSKIYLNHATTGKTVTIFIVSPSIREV